MPDVSLGPVLLRVAWHGFQQKEEWARILPGVKHLRSGSGCLGRSVPPGIRCIDHHSCVSTWTNPDTDYEASHASVLTVLLAQTQVFPDSVPLSQPRSEPDENTVIRPCVAADRVPSVSSGGRQRCD